jgi:hypothetical protein
MATMATVWHVAVLSKAHAARNQPEMGAMLRVPCNRPSRISSASCALRSESSVCHAVFDDAE